jgi:hypothetical protein
VPWGLIQAAVYLLLSLIDAYVRMSQEGMGRRTRSRALACAVAAAAIGGGAAFVQHARLPGSKACAAATRLRMSATESRPMTLTEKILAKASGKAYVQPNDNVWVNVDGLMTHDVCGPGTFGIFKKEFGPSAKVWDRERVIIIPDHYIFTADQRANRNVDILREFVQEQNIK